MRNPFAQNEYRLLRLRVCRANGWTLAQWDSLDENEKSEWLTYEVYREKTLRAYEDALMEASVKPPPPKGAAKKPSVNTSEWLALRLERL